MEIHKDYCSGCKIKSDTLSNYSTKVRKNGNIHHYYYCRDCNKKKYQKWYNQNPEKAREAIYRNNIIHKEKVAARYLLRLAVKNGTVVKPTVCSVCSSKKSIQGHHHDYTKPLDVEWLCSNCHANRHNAVL